MHQARTLAAATWPEIAGSNSLLLVPVGSCEQHGPHLPLGTDSTIARAVATAAAARLDDVVVGPTVHYGSSGEHSAFPGTISIGARVLESVLVEIGRSGDHFAGVVFVNGHGGNAAPLAAAVARLQSEGRRALGWSARVPGSDAHAGHTETSVLLALDPDAVRLDRVEVGATRPLADLMDELRAAGVAAVSANGVLGDPRHASAGDGRRVLDALTDDLVDRVRRWRSS